jgi:hypothetical protein
MSYDRFCIYNIEKTLFSKSEAYETYSGTEDDLFYSVTKKRALVSDGPMAIALNMLWQSAERGHSATDEFA